MALICGSAWGELTRRTLLGLLPQHVWAVAFGDGWIFSSDLVEEKSRSRCGGDVGMVILVCTTI